MPIMVLKVCTWRIGERQTVSIVYRVHWFTHVPNHIPQRAQRRPKGVRDHVPWKYLRSTISR